MLKDIIIIDDIFDDPDEITFRARQFEYYDRKSHPECEFANQSYYSGYRTELLRIIDPKLNNFCNSKIMERMLDDSFGLYRTNTSFQSYTDLYFHYTTRKDVFNDNWFHKDPNLYAGVVYLQKKPTLNSGTILKYNGEDIIVENKYNRLVLYRSDITHSVQNTFGNNVHDGRLTLTIFYNFLSFNIEFDDNKFKKNQIDGP